MLRLVPVLALVLAACSPAVVSPDGGTPTSTPTTKAPDAAAANAAARAEVERLRAVADKDPMLAPWTGPYGGVPPWDKIKSDLFPRAFETGLALLLAEIDVIATDPAAPTFDNTIVPLEDSGRHQDRAETLFAVMTSNLNTPDVQAVDKEWSPKMTEARDKIFFNERLFARIAKLHENTEGLSAEQKRLVDRTYDAFVRAGAKLNAEEKAKLGKINQELSVLFTDFGNKVLADEDSWVVIEKKEDLAGLSDAQKAAFAAAAKDRKLEGKWIVVNTRSSVDPFLTFSSRRDLREKVYKAFKSRGDNGNANDTKATIAKIVALRADRAKLLGYASHAHWRMSDTMAKDPAKAKELMMRVWPAAVERVKEEVADMMPLFRKDEKTAAFEPWDYLYYAEKVRKKKYALDQAEVTPYFELDNMIAASFYMAEQLYGLAFTEITGKVPGFFEGVRVWEVTDKKTGAHVGLFYGDYFARKNKRSGAWAMGYRTHETFTGKVKTPITSNNNNFVRAAAGEPVLISLDDAQTLFHEFGHALHGLLSEVNYPGLYTTPRDFVEYPSQVHEMWVLTRPILDKFAKHVKTKKVMPQALVEKIEKSKTFNQGYATVEYLSAAILDMELHTRADGKVDAAAFEQETLAKMGAPKEVRKRHRLPPFNHLFTSDAYSAGYYSYLWSEVMDADTREAFTSTGDVFDKTTADKMRKYILAPGNTTDRSEAYRQFRGRDPDVSALLRKRGFPAPPAPKTGG
ncbi:MAG: M3 family metallopeptidase [Polyangiaceae bacterium]|nr:M3 family metallopeptidase [Polyangiaceae bacterium]